VQDDLDILRDRGVGSWPDLVAVLNDRSAGEVRARACWLLGRMHDERALDPLVCALHDPDPRLRAAAARSLGALGSRGAIPELVAALQAAADPRRSSDSAYRPVTCMLAAGRDGERGQPAQL
jgi:HEAT repeat protein